jgi:hypothetical protein
MKSAKSISSGNVAMSVWRRYKASKFELGSRTSPRGVGGRGVAVILRELRGALFLLRPVGQVLDHRVAEFAVAGMVEGCEHGAGVYFKKQEAAGVGRGFEICGRKIET